MFLHQGGAPAAGRALFVQFLAPFSCLWRLNLAFDPDFANRVGVFRTTVAGRIRHPGHLGLPFGFLGLRLLCVFFFRSDILALSKP
jgi:hypothetical protein